MRRGIGLLTGIALLALAVLLGLYGLFAVLYGGDSGGSGDTYVTIADHEIDADVAGAIALLIACFTLALSAVFLRGARRN
jgi:ABC-type sugar transport system permease subunit